MRVLVGILIALLGPVATAQAAFDVIGHRGTRGHRPENTIAAFQYGLDLGATKVEGDAVATKDGYVVLSHDPTVNKDLCRGPYVGELIKDLTLEQIREQDCGTRQVRDRFRKSETSIPGAHIPELAQILRLIRPTTGKLLLEVKQDPTDRADYVPSRRLVRLTVETIRKQQMLPRVTIQSFNWGVLRRFGRVEPRLRRVALANSITVYPRSPWLGGISVASKPFDAGLAEAAAGADFDGLSVVSDLITPENVADAHDQGLRVIAYTVDDHEEMAALIEMGVDGIISDFPDRLVRVARAVGVKIAR